MYKPPSSVDTLAIKVFEQEEEPAGHHELAMLKHVSSHPQYFVQVWGWTRVRGKFALATNLITIKHRHFYANSPAELRHYATKLLEVRRSVIFPLSLSRRFSVSTMTLASFTVMLSLRMRSGMKQHSVSD